MKEKQIRVHEIKIQIAQCARKREKVLQKYLKKYEKYDEERFIEFLSREYDKKKRHFLKKLGVPLQIIL